jgi:hypothetical protein
MSALEPDGIVIVSGLPRSGSSLMMQMLGAGGVPLLSDQLRPADEDNPRGYFEYEPVKRTLQDASWLAAAPGKAVKVLYLLLPGLPPRYHYRVLFMRRPLEEVVASQRRMLERAGQRGADLPDETMAAIFRKQLERTAAWLVARPDFRVLNVEYLDCIRQPAVAAGAVSRFLDLPLNQEAMAAAVDPSLYRSRAAR